MVRKINSNTYDNGDVGAIGGNNVTFTVKDFVAKVGGYLVLATSSYPIAGRCKQNIKTASNNTTVAKAKVIYEEQKPQTTWLLPITGGTLTQADEGKYFDLVDSQSVDGTSGKTTHGQLQLVKFISKDESIFKIANVAEDQTGS